MHSRATILFLILLAASGCTSLQREPGFSDVSTSTQKRTGAAIHWNQGTDADRAVEQRVRDMLSRELTADDAVQVALLNNPRLQARYEELGVAQADVVQAGLLKNPVFEGFVRWPDGAGGPNVEFSVAADFIDMLFMPARKKIAAAGFERVKLDVADAVVAHAFEVRSAYYTLAGAQQMLELRRSVVSAEQAAAETARQIRAAGNISQLDADRAQASAAQAELELIQAETDASAEREHLAALMGVAGAADDLLIASRLPTPPTADESLATLESRAINDRLDLAAAKQETIALGESLGFSRNTALISEGQIGVSTEREPNGERVTGPEFSVPIPLFDMGQARVASATYRLRESRHRLDALKQQATAEVRIAHTRMTAARRRFERYRQVVLPLQHQIVEQSQLHYNGMLLGVFELLQAKQAEINAGREYVDSLRDYWTARAELERAVGGRLNEAPSSRPATAPATMPASQPVNPHQYHQH